MAAAPVSSCATCSARRTSRARASIPRDSGLLAVRQRLRRLPVEQRDQVRRLQAQLGQRRHVVLRQQVGAALDQGRLPVRAHRQHAAGRRAVPDDQPALGFAAQHARRPQRARHLRPLHGDARLQLRRHPHQRVGLFVQDAWTVRPEPHAQSRRAHRQGRDSVVHRGQPGIKFGFKDKISPRAGFAWDIMGDGKWKGYGSFGIFYDTSKLEMPRGLFGSEHSVTYYMTLDTFNWPSIQCGHPPVPGPNCPGTFIEQVDFRHAANEEDNFLIDPNLKPIRTREFTFGLDHELTPRIAVGVRYSRKRFDRTIEDTGVLVPGIGEVYRITNPGEGIGENVLRDFAGCTTCPNQPKPTRNYDGVEFRFLKRLSNSWQVTTHVSLQPAVGQLLRPDQLGREQPQLAERQPLLRRPVLLVRSHRPAGVRACCRPIARTCSRSRARTILPWGTGVGLYWLAESGTPLQTRDAREGHSVLPLRPRRSRPHADADPHRPARSSTTSGCSGPRINVGLNIENLFDQDTVTRCHDCRIATRSTSPTRRSSAARSIRSRCRPRRRRPTGPSRASAWPISARPRREMRLQVKYSF